MEKVLTVEMQIAERARKNRSEALTNLHEFINEPLLQESFNTLNKKGASGVDSETWIDCHKQRETRISQLLTAFKSGNYLHLTSGGFIYPKVMEKAVHWACPR